MTLTSERRPAMPKRTPAEKGCVAVNVEVPRQLWVEAKHAAINRDISLRQLLINGLELSLNHSGVVVVHGSGAIENDLRGMFTKAPSDTMEKARKKGESTLRF